MRVGGASSLKQTWRQGESGAAEPALLYRAVRGLPGAELEVPDVLLHLSGVLEGAREQGKQGGQGQGPW